VSLATWLIVGAVENEITDGYLYVAPALLLSISALVDVRPRRPTYGSHVVSRPRSLGRSRAPQLRQRPAVGSPEDGWLGGWFRDSGILLVSQVMLTATATLVMILLSRGLSKYQFGVFASFLGFSQALSFVVDVGLPLWLLREAIHSYAVGTAAAAKREVYERLWHSAYAVAGIGVVLATVVALAAIGLGLTPVLALAQAGFIIYVALLAVSMCLETDLRARRRPGLVVVATMVEKSTILAGVVVALTMHWGVVGIAGATVLGGCGRLAFSYSRTLWGSGVARPHIGRGSVLVLRGSAPFAGNTASLSFFPRIDTPVVALISVVSASYFTLGFQVTTTALLLPGIASMTLLPFLHGKDGTARRRVGAVVVMGALGVAAAVGGWLLSPFVIPLMFGSRYHAAVRTVQIMWLGMPFAFIAYALLTLLYAIGREHAVAVAIWVPSLLGTGLVVAGAVLWGAPGAAGGYAARYVLQALVVAVIARRGFAATRASTESPAEAVAG
jgi:O-antigen/teichoic acid export membrane protein